MKKRIPTFLAGMVTMAIIGGVTVSALAAVGSFTITVDPVNIQVNGQVFAPKDAKGNSVPVFAYNGTTYAPLRALAEAYGLTVGYDGTSNMATVANPTVLPVDPEPTDPTTPPAFSWTAENEALYQEFKGMWKVESTTDKYPPFRSVTLQYQGEGTTMLKELILSNEENVIYALTERFALELFEENRDAETLLINYWCSNKIIWSDKYHSIEQLMGGVKIHFKSGFYRSDALATLG